MTCLLSRTDHSADRPVVVAIDGRSGSGKTRLAARLAAAVTPSALIHTDDLSWNHAFFDWADLLVDVLAEVRANRHRGSAR